MKVVFAADHAGYLLKEVLKPFVASLGYEVEDVGAYTLDPADDYVPFMKALAEKISKDQSLMGVTIGGSGQGEAMVPNRYKGVRAVVWYGGPMDIVTLSREHNNANVLSLGARFMTEDEAKEAVKRWLATSFAGGRHERRVAMIDA